MFNDLLNHILDNYKIDTVIHFAAQSHVQNSFEDSLKYTYDNILGTHTLLESCRKYGEIKNLFIYLLMKFMENHYYQKMKKRKMNNQYYVQQIHMPQQKLVLN